MTRGAVRYPHSWTGWDKAEQGVDLREVAQCRRCHRRARHCVVLFDPATHEPVVRFNCPRYTEEVCRRSTARSGPCDGAQARILHERASLSLYGPARTRKALADLLDPEGGEYREYQPGSPIRHSGWYCDQHGLLSRDREPGSRRCYACDFDRPHHRMIVEAFGFEYRTRARSGAAVEIETLYGRTQWMLPRRGDVVRCELCGALWGGLSERRKCLPLEALTVSWARKQESLARKQELLARKRALRKCRSRLQSVCSLMTATDRESATRKAKETLAQWRERDVNEANQATRGTVLVP